MKLWCRTKKRIAKKRIGSNWKKLNYARHLKCGDLVSTCKGFNERIKSIEPVWRGLCIIDFDIITESGTSCSIVHCCTLPVKTKEEVISYWKSWSLEDSKQFYWYNMVKAVLEGKEVFDEDGQPLYEYCRDYEKQARFPEVKNDL